MTELKVIVKQVRQEALDVRSFELVAADAKQQRIIGSETDPVFQVAIKADAGPTQGRRLASMIESEARGSTA